ncbi:RNA 2'-phosphotransferase [Myxococcota bacterium]|nr:RNA 2'-phosphotransferase [Myxococcota bacterium]
MSKPTLQLSKFLSFLLRHGAEEFGLVLDDQGFADFDAVWCCVEDRYGKRFTQDDLDEVLAGDKDGKKRFERIDGKIRAFYGHSKVTPIVYEEAAPPAFLYHGTTPEAWQKIQQTGLLPMQRQYVHLTIELERARSVARRYTPHPLILRIHAEKAHDSGVKFFQPDQEHFLSEPIPPAFLEKTDL